MRCAPGDLAIILRAAPEDRHMLCRPVRVGERDPLWTRLTGVPHWTTNEGCFPDAALLPVGRPDNDYNPARRPRPTPLMPATA